MFQANIHQAKTNLSQLIQRAEAGEIVIIAKAGKPCVQLTGIEKPARNSVIWKIRIFHVFLRMTMKRQLYLRSRLCEKDSA